MKKIINIFLPLAGGSIIGFLTRKDMNLDNLVQPFLTPPKIVFPIVWTGIYLLLGISWYLYNKEEIYKNKKTSVLYYTSLIVNYLWSILFFTLKLRLFSILWIILLDILVLCLLKEFKKNYKPSFYLNIPYAIWLILATYLTIGIYILN